MEWVLAPLKNYADFSGRARRREYWSFALGIVIVGILLVFAAQKAAAILAILVLFYLAVIIPGLAVTVRRLHDTGRSGWFILLGFIPLVGTIVLLVFYLQDSAPGPNQYGPNPKGA